MLASGAGGRHEQRADARASKRALSAAARKAIPLRARRRLLRALSVLFGLSLCALLGSAASSVVAFVRTPMFKIISCLQWSSCVRCWL
eukprot:COSAG02_NODE_1620_length_11617_cov_3.185275_10_plen_88_part_00